MWSSQWLTHMSEKWLSICRGRKGNGAMGFIIWQAIGSHHPAHNGKCRFPKAARGQVIDTWSVPDSKSGKIDFTSVWEELQHRITQDYTYWGGSICGYFYKLTLR